MSSSGLKSPSTSSIELVMIIIAQFILLIVIFSPGYNAQIVSHELRRLATSTNQFGIDCLKALHRVEPPDKVLVFCPVCLSSSLMMIMMGSSKYQVVSSLRHALYVWSMRPNEINKGFKDLFAHIGVNQNNDKKNQTLALNRIDTAKTQISTRELYNDALESDFEFVQKESNRLSNHMRRSPDSSSQSEYRLGPTLASLPNLIKLREMQQRPITPTDHRQPWWQPMKAKSDESPTRTTGTTVSITSSKNNSTSYTNFTTNDRIGDVSQMNALSNIYIQRGLILNYNYNLLLRQSYRTVIHPVDFIHNTEETRQHINSLVAKNTEFKIKDLLKKGSSDTKTIAPKIMMISAFHFRGTLDIEMKTKDSARSRGKELTRGRRQNIEVKRQDNSTNNRTSHQTKVDASKYIATEVTLLKYGQFHDLDCSVVEIPFTNRLVTLIILMPNQWNSTEILLSKLSARILSDVIDSLVVRKLSLEIPVIKFDRGPINVKGIVEELGLDSIFYGNQPYSTETGLNRWMKPSDIVHETSIDIGTINPNWSQAEDRLKVGAHDSRTADSSHLKLEKPFLYFVFDSINSLILTMGRIER